MIFTAFWSYVQVTWPRACLKCTHVEVLLEGSSKAMRRLQQRVRLLGKKWPRCYHKMLLSFACMAKQLQHSQLPLRKLGGQPRQVQALGNCIQN